jgi:flagellar protein FlaF
VNAIQRAQTAYGHHARATNTPRDTEYDAFARVTQRLTAAAKTPGDVPELAAALYDNRRLWMILASDVALKSNPLPGDLKARLIYLAEFAEVHGRKVLAGKATAEPLIEVNRAVMQGLQNRSPGQ